MKRRLSIPLVVVLLAVTASAPARATVPAQGEEEIKRVYTGALIGLGGALAGRSTTFTLTLDSLVTRDQAMRYAELLRTKGQRALLDQLEDRNVGTFSVTGSTGRTVNFAYEQATDEGRRVIVLFERWLQPFELRYGTRSQDYPFTYLEMSVDKNGKGSGTLIGAAKVYFEKDDPNQLTVENFSTYPIRITNVELKR